jgi:putative transposase
MRTKSKPTNHMKRTNTKLLARASTKSDQALILEQCLPTLRLVQEIKPEIEAFSAQVGLKIMYRCMEEEIERRCGPWGEQTHYRHGSQPGYVVFHGRKVGVTRPRLRDKATGEAALETYQLFQQDGRLQRAVARQLLRQVSTRNYAGAIEDCLEGYGVKRSSVSRQWKAATSGELERLCCRPVPSNLVALIIDGKHLKRDCAVVALGVDGEGAKQVLGLWHGASENVSVVKGLLEDLVERGLNPVARLLVVIDGAKALRRAVKDLFGNRALIQRCRIHKRRNVLEHLPKEKQRQAAWRLKIAWGQTDPDKALAELRRIVRWLQPISPGAARSLEEGLEETLTVTRLGLHPELVKTFASTNLIESCFSQAEELTRRVKRWRNAEMFLRWSAAALLFAEKGFRKVRGFSHLARLKRALQHHNLDSHQAAA